MYYIYMLIINEGFNGNIILRMEVLIGNTYLQMEVFMGESTTNGSLWLRSTSN